MRVCFSAVSGRAGFQTGNLRGHFPLFEPANLTERDEMISLQKHGWLVVVLAGAALAACVQGEQQSQSADSTARNLTLAPTESTAALKDVPPPATEAAKPAPEKKAPVKKPVAAKPAPLMLAAGTRVPATANGKSYAIDASVVAMDTVMKGRGVTKADAAKVAGGAVAGAIVGKLLGKNTKGAVIGGAAGAAAGAAAARASRDIDVVIPKGAGITIKLNAPLTVKTA